MSQFNCLLSCLIIIPGHNVLRFAFTDVPNRDTMSPPKLTRDTPIMNICEPIFPDLVESFWDNLDVAFLDCFQSLGTHSLCFDKPLTADKRLDNLTTTLGSRNALSVGINFDSELSSFHIRPKLLSTFKSIQTNVISGINIHRAILVHDIDNREVELLSDGIVIWVVPGCDFERSSTELHIDVLISNDWDRSPISHGYNGVLPH
mmetsp:Transcript_10635/g.15182  ORF Transcript_10635/g.15182 Transcript_10635/m.15182 type:complete len:204 (-) Transcript_10635:677-1288(-)